MDQSFRQFIQKTFRICYLSWIESCYCFRKLVILKNSRYIQKYASKVYFKPSGGRIEPCILEKCTKHKYSWTNVQKYPVFNFNNFSVFDVMYLFHFNVFCLYLSLLPRLTHIQPHLLNFPASCITTSVPIFIVQIP